MTFPVSNLLADSLLDAQTVVKRVKRGSQGIHTRSTNGDIISRGIFSYTTMLADSLDELNALKAVPGITQYAKDQFGDQALDIVVEFNAVVAAIQAVIDWVGVYFPANGGYVQAQSYSGGRLTDRPFTTAQMAAFRTEIQTLIDSIG